MRLLLAPIAFLLFSAAAPAPAPPRTAVAEHEAAHAAEPHLTAVVGSSEKDVYHLTTCRHARRIKPEHLVRWRSQADARAAGYRACRVCHPGA